MAEVLHQRGTRSAILVSADDGLDELSLGAPSTLEFVSTEGRSRQRIDAGEELGLRHSAADIRGGDVAENVAFTRAFLDGAPGPIFDTVCANAALALMLAGRATTLRDGFELASESVREGRAANALELLVATSHA
jgi:anthranilate phosphoribosyltransferase